LQDSGCWLLAAGCWLLAAGCWLLNCMAPPEKSSLNVMVGPIFLACFAWSRGCGKLRIVVDSLDTDKSFICFFCMTLEGGQGSGIGDQGSEKHGGAQRRVI
jgi:hypothetical protein